MQEIPLFLRDIQINEVGRRAIPSASSMRADGPVARYAKTGLLGVSFSLRYVERHDTLE